ncbi:HDIG domain-containing protein [Flavobacteriales bacterium]|jgi:putative nucleotidyltransferase with HDIG domain|nr:HDIG domain-containing protein [Flavobacteriales bacterium]
MKKVFELIRNQHSSIYRLALFILAIGVGVYIMPRKKSFKYEPIEGKPWPHENLISDMEFSIKKPIEKVNAEKQQVQNQKSFFFTLNKERQEEATEKLKYGLERFASNKLENKPVLRSEKEHQKYVSNLQKKVKTIWAKIYKKGVIQNTPSIIDKDGNYVIYVDTGDGSSAKYLNKIFTVNQATDLIKKINITDEDDYKESVNLLIEALTQNILFDTYATEINLDNELKKISNVSGKVEVGELIVSKGELLNEETYLKVISYQSEFEGKQISERDNRIILVGQTLLISLCFLIIFLFMMKNRTSLFKDTSAIKLILLNVILFLALARFSLFFNNTYLIYVVPFCALPLVIRSFYDLRLALFVHTITIVLVGWLAPDPFHFVFIQLMAGILSVLTIENLYKRSDLFISVGKIAIVYFITFMGISMITRMDLFGQDFIVYGFLLISAFLTLFTYPLVYIYEKLFSLVSDISLLELADTNHPLLKEMAEKAPGTFQHSLQVSSLAEQAIMEIGGNALLVRAGALYHDIGKVDNTLFFIENQMAGINPHDELSADESAKLIISHVIKGIEKAKKHNLPEQIIDFIRTHHGDGMVQYFYRQYVKKFPDKMNETEMFRYPGPKPFSKETAVLMMADSVEAATRSLAVKNSENVSGMVEKIIQNQMNDGQFNHASITLKEIDIIKKLFIKKLLNIHHLRVEYPS